MPEHMFDKYSDKQFVELIFTSEDRIGMEYVKEAKKRRSAIVPLLCCLLQREENYQCDDQRFWGVIHAVYILGILKDMRTVEAFFSASRFADAQDIEWILDALPECYLRLGMGVIPRLKEYIERNKSLNSLAIASQIIGLWNLLDAYPETRPESEDFLLAIINSPDTGLLVRTNLMADFAKLGRKDLKPLFEKFYERGEADLNVFTMADLDNIFTRQNRPTVSHYDLEGFYNLEEIARRQKIWKEERERMEQEALEEFILNNYDCIGAEEACPCGSRKQFHECHLPWARNELVHLKGKGKIASDTMMQGALRIAERKYETEIRRLLARKDQAHLFPKLKGKALELLNAPIEDFISGRFTVYFEPVLSKVAFEGQGDYKNFMKNFLEYFNSISQQRYNLL